MTDLENKAEFEDWFACNSTLDHVYVRGERMDEEGNYYSEHVYLAWSAWQAAKAQAIPEGFILVPKEPSADLVNHGHQVFLGHFNEGGQTGGRSLYFAYKAMIEAQEQSHE